MPFQIPIPQFGLPPTLYQRQLKSGQVLGYHVKGSRIGDDGEVKYEYDMQLQTERLAATKKGIVEVKDVLRVDAVLQNMRAVFEIGPHNKKGKFGLIPMNMGASGVPQGMSAGGALNPYVFPMLAFSPPPSTLDRDFKFHIPSFQIQQVGNVFGDGQIVQIGRSGIVVAYTFTIDDGGVGGQLTCRSTYAPYGGRMIAAEGKYKGGDGTMEFKISS